MSDSVQIKELPHDVEKAFVPSPASPYSTITTTTLSFASSSSPYSSTPYCSICSPPPSILPSTSSLLPSPPTHSTLSLHQSTSSSSPSSSTIPLTPPPTPPTVSATSCQMTFREAVQNGNTTVLQRLLEEREGKINVNLFDKEGQTALHHVCLRGNLELVKLLVKFGADVGLANRDGWNPLHIAAWGGHTDILVYLTTVRRKKQS